MVCNLECGVLGVNQAFLYPSCTDLQSSDVPERLSHTPSCAHYLCHVSGLLFFQPALAISGSFSHEYLERGSESHKRHSQVASPW